MIYTLNNDVLSMVKDIFSLNEANVYSLIQSEFNRCKALLKKKGVNYDSLQNALIPTKDLNYKEIALWFDITQIDDDFYGREIMSCILPVLDKKSTCSILMGDYLDKLPDSNSQELLYKLLNKKLKKYHDVNFIRSEQFFVIYINRLTTAQTYAIVDAVKNCNWFLGYTDLFDSSALKSYLSTILLNKCVKCKDVMIIANPDGFMDQNANINIHGFPYVENGYRILSVDEECFNTFLSYKIETVILPPEDNAFSINAICPKFQYMKNLKIEIPIEKWKYLNRDTTTEQKGKGEIMKVLASELQDIDSFKECILSNLCNNYIYKLEKNEYGDYKFCECIGLKTKNGHYRKTLISLKYIPNESKLILITIT